MATLPITPPGSCAFDLLALGEFMPRFALGAGGVGRTHTVKACDGSIQPAPGHWA